MATTVRYFDILIKVYFYISPRLYKGRFTLMKYIDDNCQQQCS